MASSARNNNSAAANRLAVHAVQSLRRHASDIVLLDDISNKSQPLSGDQLLYRAIRVEAALRHAGCTNASSVLVFSELELDVASVVLAGLLSGIRVAILRHTADIRELKQALHAVRPTFVFCSTSASAVVKRVKRKDWPDLQQILVYGDEFLGRAELGSFNVFVRDSRVPSVNKDRFEPAAAQLGPPADRKGGAAVDAAILLLTWDATGRYREIGLSATSLLDRLRREGGREGPLLLSNVDGLIVTEEVIVRLLQHAFGGRIGAKL